MANRRDLKKDINFLTTEMLIQCDVKLFLNPEGKKEQVLEVAEAIIAAKDEALSKVTKADFVQGGNKPGKKYFKTVVIDFVEKSDVLLEKLAAL